MECRYLGDTGINVSRMCFGALTIGPLQERLPLGEGAAVIRSALEHGVNFIDTAQMYGTYSYIRKALKGFGGQVVVASKSYAYTREDMAKALEEARREMDLDVVDIFMLHEQESIQTIRGHGEALDFLVEAKAKGLVRAVGLSTHRVSGVEAAIQVPEIQVVHPMVNFKGVGIQDGTIKDMLAVLDKAYRAGKGIYGMKPLGGGNLMHQFEEAFSFVLGLPQLASVALGMKSVAEVELNVQIFNGEKVSPQLMDKVRGLTRRLHIEDWCQQCGRCIERCHSGALTMAGGKVAVEKEKCVLCGYCGAVCAEFCIKII
ncbi:MAG: aldo/keto reductase [Clostridia bacterium]|nr:aldo/keto reductase [Clostridia bacterium]